ncbi:hypothetical protein JOB18_041996 [Solea senegalensis]|uniref:Uncharacterized protein n=1 Tax=Solea senegalensis TaxID=28829 RepID=A0AAV6PX56_SOLSE|nr:hypothetical protein JOB18_041996 [Solea senegalensis]
MTTPPTSRLSGRIMRRSAAPSQLFGNAVKKPRFVPPGASTVIDSKLLSPKLGLGNALEKIQKSLAAPVPSTTGGDNQLKAAQPAPALSRALARVLNATESKENDAKLEYPETDTDFAESKRLAVHRDAAAITALQCRSSAFCAVPGLRFTETELKVGRAGLKRLSYVRLSWEEFIQSSLR